MRKLKTLLVLLFAACLSFALFACGGNEEEQKGSEGSTLNRVSGNQIELTDADTQDTFNTKMQTYKLTGSTDDGRVEILGSDCDITGEIKFGEIDRYTVTFKPKENNANGVTAEVIVVIDHAWSAPDANGQETCAHDGATRITKDEDVSIHYGNFHTGTGVGPSGAVVDAATAIPKVLLTEDDAASLGLHAENQTTSVFNPAAGINQGVTSSGRIAAFGKDARANKEVPTITAGDLAPGMSITIEGYAKTDVVGATQETPGGPWNVTNGNWNAPSYGIADPYSPLSSTSNAGGINVGTAVIVRSEGWVLYNGIGQELNNTLGGLPAFIEGGGAYGKESGSTEGSNCASWDRATADTLDGQDVTNRPAYTSSDWKNWWVYSEGTDRHSLDSYQSFIHVRVTWTYRTYGEGDDQVGIIVIDSDYLDEDTTLRSYIKVPAATRGAYRTIIHGDYSTLLITKTAYVETETITDMRISETLQDGAKTEYLAGEQIDAGSVFKMEITSKQNTAWHSSGVALTNDMLYYYKGAGTTYEAAEAAIDTADDWEAIGDQPLTPAMKYFKVVLDRGDAHLQRMVPKTACEKIKISENNVAGAVSDSYGTLDSRDPMAKYTVTLGTGTGSARYVDLKIDKALFREIPTDALGTNGVFNTALTEANATDYRFTAIRILGIAENGFSSITEEQKKAGAENAYFYSYKVDGNDVLLAVAIKAASLGEPIVIEGVQTATPVRVTFGTGSLGFTVQSSITADKPTLNGGGNVTVTYKNVTSDVARIQVLAGGTEAVGAVRITALENAFTAAGATHEPVDLGNGFSVTDYSKDGTTVTVVIKFPAFDLSWTTMPYVRAVNNAVTTTYAEDYIEYDLHTITGNETNSENGVYFTESNGTLYFVTAHEAAKGSDVNFANIEGGKVVNINNGVTAKSLNLGYKYDSGTLAFADKNLGSAIALKTIVLEKAYGDYGVLVVASVDVAAATGIDIAQGYGFQIGNAAGNDNHYWKYDTTNKKIARAAISGPLKSVVVEEGDCFTKGVVASDVVEGGKVVFLANYTEIEGQHDWNGGDTCAKCGATKEAATLTYDENDHRNTLNAGEFVEISGTYNNVKHKEAFNGIETNVRQTSGTAFYVRVRNDGYYAREAGEDAQATLLYNSTPLNTANGVPNGINGQPINTDSDYIEAKSEGTFRVVAYFVGGDTRVVTVVTSLWTKEQTAYVDTPYFTYTVQIKIGGLAESVAVNFRLDNYTPGSSVAGLGAEGVNIIKGEISGNTLTGYDSATTIHAANGSNTAADFSITGIENEESEYVGAYEEGKLPAYAKSLVPTGKAGKLTAAQKTALGVTDANINYFYSFTANLGVSAGETTVRLIDLSTGNVYQNGYVNLTSGVLKVVIPYSEANTRFKLDFANTLMNTEQGDIVIDLGQLSVSDITMTKPGDVNILGGDVTITVTGTVPDDAELHLGDESVAWSALTTKKTLGALEVVRSGNTLTVTVPKADVTKQVVGYTLVLRTANGGLLAQTEIDPLSLPTTAAAGDVDIQDFYVVANGDTLTFVAQSIDLEDETESLVLNINNGTKDGLLNNYNVTAQVNAAGEASFVDSNALTAKGTLVWSHLGASTLLAITFDLSDFAGSAYGFQVGSETGKIYTVNAAREIAAVNKPTDGTSESISTASCTEGGLTAKKYTQGGINFYYDITVTAAHNYQIAENGGGAYVCQTCGAVLKADDVKNFAVPAALLAPKEGTLVDTGISISMLINEGSGGDFTSIVVKTASNAIITMPNLDPWNIDTNHAGMSDEAKTLGNKVKGGNAVPSVNGGIGTLGDGHTWNEPQGKVSYITVVINKTAGIKIYMNGSLFITYAADGVIASGTVADMAEFMLIEIARTGVIVGSGALINSATALEIEMKSFTDEEAAARYNTYLLENSVYPVHGTPGEDHRDNDNDHLCDYCGETMEHQHSYNTSTHKCTVCGELAPTTGNTHTWTENVCSVCGARKIAKGEKFAAAEEVTITNNDTSDGFWGDTARSSTFTVPAGDFAVYLSWSWTLEAEDRMVLEIDGSVDVRVFTKNANNALDCWGAFQDGGGTVTFSGTKTPQDGSGTAFDKDSFPTAHTGTYSAIITRIGTTLEFTITFTDATGTVWVGTYTYANYNTDAHTMLVTGDPFYAQNIKGYVGTFDPAE